MTPGEERSVVSAVGRGLAAGALGTAALSAAERLEMRVTGREASSVPGQVGAKLAGHDPSADPELVERLNPVVHWAHGIGLGAVRGLLDTAGLQPRVATLFFFPIVFGGDSALYRALGIASAPWQWSREDLMRDLFGKGVLAFATSGAYIALSKKG